MEDARQLIGRLLDDRYLLKALVGTGGTAAVFRAEDLLLRRTVALKLLRQADDADEETPAAREAAAIRRAAFRREAQAATTLSHPNIVTVYDLSPPGDLLYLVMEYVDGEPLSDRLRAGPPLSTAEQLRVAAGVLAALREAHAHGIVHRDIKAQNILLTREGQVKVTDFGIAEIGGRAPIRLRGRVLGSVDTISPEQAAGRPSDARSDLYSLGAVMYQMATGHLPFEDDDPETVAFLHQTEPPRYPSTWDPCVPRGLEQVILTALAKAPGDRFPNAEAMAAAVEKLRRDPTYVFHRFSARRAAGVSRFFAGMPAVLSVLLGFFLCAALFLPLCLFCAEPLLPVTVVEVPACVTYPDGLPALDARIGVSVTWVYDPTLPEGTVLSQFPAAGSYLKLDGEEDRAELTLTVSTRTPPT